MFKFIVLSNNYNNVTSNCFGEAAVFPSSELLGKFVKKKK